MESGINIPDPQLPERKLSDCRGTNSLNLISCCVFRSPLEKTRYETSLGLLTKKFVSLFHTDPSGTVDLNKASLGKYRYLRSL
jgi:hypothetical protein